MARTATSELPVGFLLLHLFRRALSVERAASPSLFATATAACAAAAIPWFHLRYGIMAGLLAAGFLVLGRGLGRVVPLVAFALSSCLVLVSFNALYGSWKPSALYGHTDGYLMRPTLRSIAGLLIDGHVGILFVAPLVVLACPAVVLCLRRAPLVVALTGLGVLVSFLIDASWSHWWLDTATPGRFWAPLVPLGAPLLGLMWSRVPRACEWAAGAAAIATATMFLAFPWASYGDGAHGVTRLWSLLWIGKVMPTLTDDIGATSTAVACLLVSVTAIGVAVSANRLARTPPGNPR